MPKSRSKLRSPHLPETGPLGFRWRLEGDALPPMTAAFRVGTATRAAIYRGADARDLLPLPDNFHAGTDGTHTHAFWLPEDADKDGLIDHVLLFAASGLPRNLVPVLAESPRLELAGLGRWRLVPDWMGRSVPGGLFGSSRNWRSATPYVTSVERNRTDRNGKPFIYDAVAQLRWEFGERQIDSKLIEVGIGSAILRGQKSFECDDFVLRARAVGFTGSGQRDVLPAHWSPPRDSERASVLLRFTRPIGGPLALGFGAHFGLGLFEPIDSLAEVDRTER